jgi:hypothetical protein
VVPTGSDSVRIGNVGSFPALDVAGTVGRLRLEAGATLQLDTFPLFVVGSLDIDPAATVLSDSIGAFTLIGVTGTVRGAMPRLYLSSGAYAVNGNLAVGGDVAVNGGTLDIGVHTATIGGLLATAGTGRIAMTSSGALTVQGDAVFAGGSTAGLLTAGTLTVRGDFTQAGGDPAAFSPGVGPYAHPGWDEPPGAHARQPRPDAFDDLHHLLHRRAQRAARRGRGRARARERREGDRRDAGHRRLARRPVTSTAHHGDPGPHGGCRHRRACRLADGAHAQRELPGGHARGVGQRRARSSSPR